MSPHRFWSTISTHINELTNEDISYIVENYSIGAKCTLQDYVAQEFNITLAALNTSLLEITPHSKRVLQRLNYRYNERSFESLLFSIGIYIFSTWNVELHQIMNSNVQAETKSSENNFGEIDLF